MSKTAGEAYRNARAISDFFEKTEEIGNAIIDAFIERHERKKYLKQTLKRFKERGLIEKRKKSYRITQKGRVFFAKYHRSDNQTKNRPEYWDGRWRLISFDVPSEFDDERVILRGALKESGFYQLQKSVWIAPYEMTKEFWKFVVLNGFHKYCKVMLIEVLDGDEELKKHFKLIK